MVWACSPTPSSSSISTARARRFFERFAGLLRDDERLDALTGRVGAGARTRGLAVEESTALILQSNRLAVVGNGNAHVFIKSLDQQQITWHTLASQSTAQLNYDDRGQAALVRHCRRHLYAAFK